MPGYTCLPRHPPYQHQILLEVLKSTNRLVLSKISEIFTFTPCALHTSKDLNIQEILFGDVRELHNARFMMTRYFWSYAGRTPLRYYMRY